MGKTKLAHVPVQYLLMENSNLCIQLPLVLIRVTENIKKKLQCICESNAIQLLDLVKTVHKVTFKMSFLRILCFLQQWDSTCAGSIGTPTTHSTQTNLEHKPESLRLPLVCSNILKKKLFTVTILAKVVQKIASLTHHYCTTTRIVNVQTWYYAHPIFSTSACSYSADWQEQ